MKRLMNSFSQILLGTLVLTGLVLLAFFQTNDRRSLEHVLEETISFTKLRINKYETFQTNDQVKSLVRLLDKTEELARDIEEWVSLDEQSLDTYAENQRLSGILVLDEGLHTVAESTAYDKNGAELWSELIQSSYVSDIVNYPKKTYTTRFDIDGITYDFAAVARRDAPGLLITYLEKDKISEVNGDLVIESLFRYFPFEMNGVVAVCLDKQVVSSNKTDLVGKSYDECQKLYSGEFKSSSDGIVKLSSEEGVWYGRRDATEDYELYMFFPASQIYMKRNTVCGIYILVAAMIYLLQLLGKSRTEKTALAREQKRLRIINAIGIAYSSITLVDLKAQEVEAIKSSHSASATHKRAALKKSLQSEHVEKLIAEGFREDYLKFIDMDTVVSRLKDNQHISYTCQTVNGDWMLSLIVPQRYDKNGSIDAVLIATRDVTEEKKHEYEQDTALRNALAAAEHANKAKTVFLNNMSHDIRTPMNAIIGFTALAQTHINNTELVQDYLEKINTSGTHLLSLINDILDMSRIESGSVRLEESPVHIPDVLHDLRVMVQGLINAKNQNLYIDTQDVCHEDVVADKLRLNQVLINIVGNAIKFTPTGGDIIVRLAEKPCQIKNYTTYEFTVKDTGIGMSKEFIGHIFDTFSREYSSTVNGIQGTGLGMSITKNIVDMMDGTIDVESEEGKGSRFTVRLDLRLAGEAVKYEPIPELLGARALVVDDDINTCRSVCRMLRDIDMRPDWTTSGKEAVLHAQDATELNDEYKVYIIDYLMPDMNGIETVRRIRHVIGDEIPIIVLTAYDWADFEKEAREAGVTAFVGKPLFMSELRGVLTKPVSEKTETAVTEDAPIIKRDYSDKRILLVEDNELNREIAIAILEETGMTIDTAADGIEAVNIINEAPDDKYDLILMDIQMPRMDGYTATREIRTLSNNKKANIPIIAMTANAFDEDRQKAFETGMNGHIVKPIDPEVLSRVLDEVLNG